MQLAHQRLVGGACQLQALRRPLGKNEAGKGSCRQGARVHAELTKEHTQRGWGEFIYPFQFSVFNGRSKLPRVRS